MDEHTSWHTHKTKQNKTKQKTNLSISKDGGIVTLEAAFDQMPYTRVINVDLCKRVIIEIVHDAIAHQCNKTRGVIKPCPKQSVKDKNIKKE